MSVSEPVIEVCNGCLELLNDVVLAVPERDEDWRVEVLAGHEAPLEGFLAKVKTCDSSAFHAGSAQYRRVV